MLGKLSGSVNTGSAGQTISDVIDCALTTLEAQLAVLDKLDFSIICIHLNDAIEKLRSEQEKLSVK